ncbi:hypothetical protein K491DRAFT_719740 [Lophiostoma macrostomum CBS 122681]|uniref:Uncharacterized protein n=1 Tax=Lophiostoma macrostomum CBS 122681 TaxID=1314788 RepID=A0A6A6SV41_9PLEO|nr:hypothetical protein K491DRAFT_719740 [Lophiostoma macrostomum CBS 122681]
MAPLPLPSIFGRAQSAPVASSVGEQLRTQWANPNDILSLLLLIGGDVVQRALAQQTGHRLPLPTPVAFSFGWVAYTFMGLLSAVGDSALLPPPEFPCIVFSTEWGYVRNNQSWIICRLLRDFEKSWMPSQVRQRFQQMLKIAGPNRKRRSGLCISVFEASSKAEAGFPRRDVYWYSGFAISGIQLLIALIPWLLWRNWEIFPITVTGTFLAYFTASLPQWSHERWACNRNVDKTMVITRGNGAQHAIVIIGAGRSLDLEDLASSAEGFPPQSAITWLFGGLTTLWCALLITVCGLTQNTWFLIAIGTLGMVHTVIIAGAPRKPESFGIHLEYRAVFTQPKVMETLKEAEAAYPGLGRSMLHTFFPGDLWPDEVAFWKEARKIEIDKKRQTKKKLEVRSVQPTNSS